MSISVIYLNLGTGMNIPNLSEPGSDGQELSALKAEHAPHAIRRRLDQGPEHPYLKDFIYGAVDGAVTTFAVVSGVAGAGLSSGVIIILGLANLVADGFSMAASNFLGSRAESQMREKARAQEHRHIDLIPDGEREEIRQIFANKGFEGADLENAVKVITSDRARWVETMLQEEHGLASKPTSEWKSAISTFVAFVIVGAIPLITFLVNWVVPGAFAHPFLWSSLLTGFAFFAVGVAKAKFVDLSKWKSGLETLMVGGGAAVLSYLIGMALRGMIPA
jgi:VIT1/CCC1 family predicted Fe2+/Mn2+ transporter